LDGWLGAGDWDVAAERWPVGPSCQRKKRAKKVWGRASDMIRTRDLWIRYKGTDHCATTTNLKVFGSHLLN
jgi:hypothetical protein